jgi:hypothetical protein
MSSWNGNTAFFLGAELNTSFPLAGGWRFEGGVPKLMHRVARDPERSEWRSNQAAIPARVDARNALFGPNR